MRACARLYLALGLGLTLNTLPAALFSADGAQPSCTPPYSQSWLSVQDRQQGSPSPTNTHVFVDGSGSMVGYIRGSTAQMEPIQDLMSTLPAASATRNDRIDFFRFAREIKPISVAEAAALATPLGYICSNADHRASCDNQESHVDQVLDKIALTPRGDVSIILTDLWLTNSDLVSTGPVALGLKFSRLFQQGRAIDIVGIAAPYKGRTFDLPLGGTYDHATSRPLFVVLVGPQTVISAYRSFITSSGSAAFAPDQIHHSLFAINPFIGTSEVVRSMRLAGNGGGFKADIVLDGQPMSEIPQYLLLRSTLFAGGPRQSNSVSGQVDFADRILPGAVWTGTYQPTTRVWMLRDEDAVQSGSCNAVTWTPFGTVPIKWDAADGSRKRWLMHFDPTSDLSSLPSGKKFFVSTYLQRTVVDAPSPDDKWLRAWSFALADQGALIKRHPSFFPTLNLSATIATLEASLQRASTSPVPLAGVQFILQVED